MHLSCATYLDGASHAVIHGWEEELAGGAAICLWMPYDGGRCASLTIGACLHRYLR